MKGGELDFLSWDVFRWAAWFFVIAPLTAWLAFHPVEVAGALGRMIVSPSSVGVEVGGVLGGAYRAWPGGGAVTRGAAAAVEGLFPGVARGMVRAPGPQAARRVPTRTVMSQPGAAGARYALTLTSDRAAYAPGDVAVIRVVAAGARGSRFAAPRSPCWSASITDPVGETTTYEGGLGVGTPALTATGWTSTGAVPCPTVAGGRVPEVCLGGHGEAVARLYARLPRAGDYVLAVSVPSADGIGTPAVARLRLHVAPPPRSPVPTVSARVTIGTILLSASAPASVRHGEPVQVAVELENSGAQPWCYNCQTVPGGTFTEVFAEGMRMAVRTPAGETVYLGETGLSDLGADPAAHGFTAVCRGPWMTACLPPGGVARITGIWYAAGRGGAPVMPGMYHLLVGADVSYPGHYVVLPVRVTQ